MKMKPLALIMAGMAAGTLVSAPLFAAPAALDDSTLDAVAGKANGYSFGTTVGTSNTMGNDNSANIQFGYFQWSDDHSADASAVKGGNDVSGISSTVQQNATGAVNALFWGGLGQNMITNTATVASQQMNMAYGTFGNGGF
jgi:hypothetical protein